MLSNIVELCLFGLFLLSLKMADADADADADALKVTHSTLFHG